MIKEYRTAARWFGAVLVVAVAGIGVDAVRPSHRATLPTALSPLIPSSPLARPIQSAVVLQKKDCSGNLRMLDLLHRGRIRDQLQLSVIWYAGPHGDSAFIRKALPHWTRHIRLMPVGSEVLASMAELGHASTPALIVLDQSARIRFITQSPQSPREFAGLARIIEGLTWIEEL